MTTKQNISPKPTKEPKQKIKIDYSKTPNIKEEIQTSIITAGTIYNKKTDKYKKPPSIKETNPKKSTDDISIDGSVSIDKEKDTIDGANIKLKKRF